MIKELIAPYITENVLNPANLFIIVIAIFWMIVASILDFKKREVENWWNFSLIIFILAFKAFLSIQTLRWNYIILAFIGLLIGFGLCNLFYYGRMFAGGDAKLLMALGVVLVMSPDWKLNLVIFSLFIVLLLFSGSVYGLGYCLIISIKNFNSLKKEFTQQIRKNRSAVYGFSLLGFILSIIFLVVGFYTGFALSLVLMISPVLLIYARAVENSCMQKFVDTKRLTIGDWLVKPLIVRGKSIKPNWEGLSEKQLKIIQKDYRKKVLIKYGIPFMPAFLIAFLLLLWLLA